MENKIPITEELHLEDEWFEQAAKMQTVDELSKFINHLLDDYQHDYGTVCHAIAACAVAAAWVGSRAENITGFQASFIMWDFIRYWIKSDNKCGLKLIDYDDFLFPQYEDKYEKAIGKSNWETIQKEAAKNLETYPDAHEKVIEHWKNIIHGIVPFGYKVKE